MSSDSLSTRLRAAFLEDLDEQLRAMNAQLIELEADSGTVEPLGSLFRALHTLKGSARAASLPLVERVCHALESRLSEVRGGGEALSAHDFRLLFAAADALERSGEVLRLGGALEGTEVATRLLALERGELPASPTLEAQPPSGERVEARVRVATERLETLLASAGQLHQLQSGLGSRLSALEALQEEIGRQLRMLHTTAGSAPGRLQEAVGRLLGDAGRMLTALTAERRALAQLSGEVLERVHELRMRPFADAAQPLPRMVRDLAAEVGKEVQFAVHGEAVEADRAVIDGLREALLHAVRNAVDHGIEPPGERERSGKPRAGSITVTASLRGEQLQVRVEDDGRGIDEAAVRGELQRRGRPVPHDPRELGRALFEGGFSTKRAATTVSGRGVGLDAVREALERIRGTVDVAWEAGRGTTFTLSCPLTLAGARVLLTTVGEHAVAIPTDAVESVRTVHADELQQLGGREVVAGRQGPVVVAPLARVLGPPFPPPSAAERVPVVFLCVSDRRIGLVVDGIASELEVVIRPVERGGAELPLLSGAALLGTGGVALVLNPPALLEAGLALEGAAGLARPESAGSRRAHILVVDDSITTRTLEQSVLEAAGYRVTTAVDGADAWRLLNERDDIELVVSDVEMPRMTGLELCEAIRSSTRHQGLPIILVSSLEKPEDRLRGMEIGADAYIGKSSFDQQGLLDVVAQLIG